MTNLSFQSRNIDKLLHIDHGPNEQVERDIKEIKKLEPKGTFSVEDVNKVQNIKNKYGL
jgi:hypothetical protein